MKFGGFMTKRGKYLQDAPLIRNGFVFTILKKVREVMALNKQEYRVLSFMLEENGEISLGFGHGKVIGSSEFIASTIS